MDSKITTEDNKEVTRLP